MASYRVISADSHVFEPADLWISRVDPKFRDRTPRVVRLDDGDWWFCDGRKGISAFAGSQTGRRFEEPEKFSIHDTVDNVRPGGSISLVST